MDYWSKHICLGVSLRVSLRSAWGLTVSRVVRMVKLGQATWCLVCLGLVFDLEQRDCTADVDELVSMDAAQRRELMRRQ